MIELCRSETSKESSAYSETQNKQKNVNIAMLDSAQSYEQSAIQTLRAICAIQKNTSA